MTASPNTPRPTIVLRAWLLATAMAVVGVAAAGVLFLGALFSHQRVLGLGAIAALIISLIGNAILEAWRVGILWRSGAWIGLGGERLSRDQKPTWFRVWLATHMVCATISVAASGYLTWTFLISAS